MLTLKEIVVNKLAYLGVKKFKCVQKLGTQLFNDFFTASLKKLKAADYSQNDPKLKCYLKCFMQKNGIFGEDDIDIEKALRHLPTGIKGPSKTTLEYCKKIRNYFLLYL